MPKISAVQAGKTFLKHYMLSMLFLITGTIIGATLSYQIVKPTIIEVSNVCIAALKEAYSKER